MSGTLSTTQYVGSGSGQSGTDSGTTIVNGGFQYVGFDFGTGTAKSTTINSGGLQVVGDDDGTGTATSTTINSGGSQYVGGQDLFDTGTGTATGTTVNNGGLQIVGNYGTGTAISTTILSGGEQDVGAGRGGTGTATSTTISGGGSQYVGLGATGTATNTTIFSGGFQFVGEGQSGIGTAKSTTILSGGRQYLGYQQFGAGTATSTILSGGAQYVGYSAGAATATSTTILSGGIQEVGFVGTGTATSTTIFGGGFQEVGFGGGGAGTATSIVIDSGGIQRVGVNFGTGTATDTTISSGGTQYVGYTDGTGTATSTTILSGGTQYIGGNGGGTGTARSTTVSGGQQLVSSGGTATGTIIYSGGVEEVLAGGVANAPVIDGGTLKLDAGASIGTGPIDFAAVSGTNGGTLDLTGEGPGSAFTSNFTAAISGFTGGGSTAATSDIIDVTGSDDAGDHVAWTQTGTSGTLEVQDANNKVLESLTLDGTYNQGWFVLTESGSVDQITYVSYTTLSTTEFVGSGSGNSGSVSNTIIVSGGAQVVGYNRGTGTATNTTISSGGTQYVAGKNTLGGTGTAISTTISSGGVQSVGEQHGTGTAIDTTIDNGGIQIVDNDGIGTATVTRTTITSGGSQYVGHFSLDSGTATSTTVFSGGIQYVGAGFSSGAVTDTILSGGTQFVGNDGGLTFNGFGTATRTTILSGGVQDVHTDSGATALAVDTTIGTGGNQFIGFGNSFDGTATSTTILSGGAQVVGGNEGNGTATDTTIDSGGQQTLGGFGQVAGGTGTATRTTISGGTQYVGWDSGTGIATSTTILSGGAQVVGGNDKGEGNGIGTATSTTLSGGTQYVSAGGTATDTIIYSGGLEEVFAGGVVTDTVISGGTMEIVAGGVVSGGIDFAGSGGTLRIDGTSMPGNTISGFVSGDMLDLAGISYSGGSADLLSGNVLQITEGGQHYDLNLDPNQSFAGEYFHLNSATGGGTMVTEDSNPCYCAGTLISTVRCDVRVEELAIGDEVLTLCSEPRPIKWIGRRSYRRPFIFRNVMPILIKAGALSENVPQRDLYVSPDHAMYINEVLIAAEHLVNGVSIVRCHDVDSVQYFHIELERHDVIFAEGAAAETFVDCNNRLMFHNAAEFDALYPADSAPGWAFCAPRIEAGPRLERIRQAIAARAGVAEPEDADACGPLEGSLDDASHMLINGWAFDPSQPGVPVWLEVLVDDGEVGRVLANLHRPDLQHDRIGTGHHGFALWLQHGLSPLSPHVVRVRRVGDGTELPGSPRLLEPRAGASLVRSCDLLPAVQAAVHAAPDMAALDEMLWSLQSSIDRVRQLRTERQMADGSNPGDGLALLTRANKQPKKIRRALVIDDRLPDPVRDAGSNAILGHIRALIALGYAVEFVPAKQMVADAPPRVPGFDAVGWHVAPAIASVEEVLRRNAGAYELIYLHSLGNASAYAGLAREWCPRAHVLYSVADLHHLRLARQAHVLGETRLLAHARAVKQAELFAMRTADAVITHSPAEAEYLAREAPGARVHVVGWPIEVAPRNVAFARRSGLAFIGSPGHEPNRDAVALLIEEIMPRVWERDPAILCEIIGAGWPEIFGDTLDHRIWLTGTVPDLTAVFDRVRLTVAPLRFGAGIKGKVLESFAAGVPCVMSPVAAEGLPLTKDLQRLVSEDSKALAELICDLHADEVRNDALGDAGARMVADGFSLKQVGDDLRLAVKRTTRTDMKRTPSLAPGLIRFARNDG